MVNSSLSVYQAQTRLTSSKIRTLLDVDRIKQNPIYTASIIGGRSLGSLGLLTQISGIYNPDSPFTISCGSEFVDTFELPPVVDKMNEVTGWAANMAGKTQFILKSVRMTEQRWNGSTAPEFSIKIDIPIVRKSDAPWKIIKYVMQATMPTLNDYNSKSGAQIQRTESSWTIFAPNGYKIHYSNSSKTSDYPEGAYTIELGRGAYTWFRMQHALITSMNCSISGKKYYDGNPVSVTVSVNFKYWRQPMFEDVVHWFPLANKF